LGVAWLPMGSLMDSCVELVCYCGKTAEWIRLPLGMVVKVGPDIGVLNFHGDYQRGRGSFGRGKVWDFPL